MNRKGNTPQTGEGDIYMNVALGNQTVDESAYMNIEEVRQVSLFQSPCAINSLYYFSINFIS